jgi:hypothetical protein
MAIFNSYVKLPEGICLIHGRFMSFQFPAVSVRLSLALLGLAMATAVERLVVLELFPI